LTIPTSAAAEFVALDPDVADHTPDDPPVVLAGDANEAQIGVFWNVEQPFRAAVAALATTDVAAGDVDGIREALRPIFPKLSDEDRARVREESKIPKAASWQNKVDRGEASWDGMLTEAALQSFSADQQSLDDRIRRFL
jgi:hypothetical protein